MEIERESIIGLFEWLTEIIFFLLINLFFPWMKCADKHAWHSTVGMFEKENIKNHT
jgi:hypothetical protein